VTILAELEGAIQQLQEQKNTLLNEIQKFGWKDDRSLERIPEVVESVMLDAVTVTPEKSPLPLSCSRDYQQWYSAARAVLAKNQPSRMAEFDQGYSEIKKLLQTRYVGKHEQFKLMDLITLQFEMLAAVPAHLRFSMYDIELTAYSILMDDELEAARYLHSKGFLRPAGALAGVILERHLKNLLRKHTPPIKYSEKAGLGKLNGLCKDSVYDLVSWRKAQHLADLRHLCTHDKTREPTRDEIEELINGVSAILKSCTPSARE
jgi:hypothetical protein